jgi:hypothetical protein
VVIYLCNESRLLFYFQHPMKNFARALKKVEENIFHHEVVAYIKLHLANAILIDFSCWLYMCFVSWSSHAHLIRNKFMEIKFMSCRWLHNRQQPWGILMALFCVSHFFDYDMPLLVACITRSLPLLCLFVLCVRMKLLKREGRNYKLHQCTILKYCCMFRVVI